MQSIEVNKNEAGQRLDKFLGKYLNLAGKSFLYKMMRKKNITLKSYALPKENTQTLFLQCLERLSLSTKK